MNRLIIFGTCSAAVSALVIGISVLSDPVFKLEIDPAVQNHFSNDKEAWWKELPVEVLPTRSGVYNHESWENEKEALGLLVLGRSILGDLPIDEVSHSKKGVVEISLSKETVDCGTKTETTSDEVRLKHRGFADIDDDGIAEQCIFLGRAIWSNCGMGSGNFSGYGGWYVLGKRTVKSRVKLLEVRESECGEGGGRISRLVDRMRIIGL